MTSGAALPIFRSEIIQDCFRRIDAEKPKWLRTPGGLALAIVRGCLAAGASEHVAYEAPMAKTKKARRRPRWRGF
jgi:hypothetical protein